MIVNVSAHRRANAFAQALEERSARGAAPEHPEDPCEHTEQTEPTEHPGRPEHPQQPQPVGATGSGGPGGAAVSAPAAGSDRARDSNQARRSEQARMLSVAAGLAGVPAPQLDPEVKTVQRTRLIAAMEAMVRDGTAPGGPEPTVPPQRSRGSHRADPGTPRSRSRLSKSLAAGGLTLGVAAGTIGGVAAASTDALPGDSLYGLKRGMEDVKLGMAASDSDRGGIYLDQASTRLSEARRLMERSRSGPLDQESVTEVRRALAGMHHDAAEGRRLLFAAYRRNGSLAPIERLSTFSRTHRGSWTALRDRLPRQLGDVRDQVTSVFDAIDQEVGPLRPLLPPAPTRTGPGSTSPYEAPGSARPTGTHDPSTGAGTPSGTGSPGPSASESGADGLLGTGPSGLFDPPLQNMDPPSPTTKGGRGERIPEHDIVLPPLLPGFLQDSTTRGAGTPDSTTPGTTAPDHTGSTPGSQEDQGQDTD